MAMAPEDRWADAHPMHREMLPDDPLSLHAAEVSGDRELMLRMLVEEYARMGWGIDALLDLARNPFYRAFHAFYETHGEAGLRRQLASILSSTGVVHTRTEESSATSDRLVDVELPTSAD